MDIESVEIQDTVSLDADVQLVLSGAGVRKKFMYKIYIAALYLTEKEKSAEAILSDQGPKRIIFHYLYDRVGVERLVEGWRSGFESNMDDNEYQSLSSSIDGFLQLLTDAVKGDQTILDYTVKNETEVWINGERKGVFEGRDLFNSLLMVLIGEHPVDEQMKDAILSN